MSSHRKRSPWTELLVNVLGCFYSPRILSIMGWKRLGRRLRDSGSSLKLCPGREVNNTKGEKGPDKSKKCQTKIISTTYRIPVTWQMY